MTMKIEDLTIGVTKASELFGDRPKDWLAQLDEQKKRYDKHNVEADLGPDATLTDYSAGEMEMYTIKQQSRFAHGRTVVENKVKGITLLSINDIENNEAPEYTSIWKKNNMDRKLRIFLVDEAIDGRGFWVVRHDQKRGWEWLVKSPRNITAFSTDFVNNTWADFGIERFTNGGVEHIRYYDSKFIMTFRNTSDKKDWILVELEEHTFGECPVIADFWEISSDGVVTGAIRRLKTVLDTLRQRTNATSQAVYWTGTRSFVINNLDQDEVRTDPTSGEEYNVADRVLNSIRMTASGIVLLPTGSSVGESPSLTQTEEGNVSQLIEAKKDALRDLASMAQLPYSIFDGTAISTTNEASLQAWMAANDDKTQVKARLGLMIELILSQIVFAETGSYKEFNISWAAGEQVTWNNTADTVSKLVAAGIDLEWIIENPELFPGFRPEQINDLRQRIQDKQSMPLSSYK